jgi:hypothetical protein
MLTRNAIAIDSPFKALGEEDMRSESLLVVGVESDGEGESRVEIPHEGTALVIAPFLHPGQRPASAQGVVNSSKLVTHGGRDA